MDQAELGTLVAEYRTGSFRHKFTMIIMGVLALPFILLIICLILFIKPAIWRESFGPITSVIVFGVCGAFFGTGFVAMVRRFGWRVLLFTNGILLQRRGPIRRFSWADIAVVREKILVLNGIESDHMLTLEMVGGGKIAFDATIRDIAALTKEIRERSYPARLARVSAEVGGGASVAFGKLKLSRAGLHQGKENIYWNEVESVGIEYRGAAYQVVIRQLGRKAPWCIRGVPDFPNLDVFLAVVDSYRTGR